MGAANKGAAGKRGIRALSRTGRARSELLERRRWANKMSGTAKVIVLLVLSLQTAGAQVSEPSYDYQPRPDPAPRLLPQKVRDAELIVFGAASAFGGTTPPLIASTMEFYERNIQVSIAAVLWPPTLTNLGEVVFPYSFLPIHPRSWWDYNNTAGVFFLTTNSAPRRARWDKLACYNDWWEPPTNLIDVLATIQNEKGKPSLSGLLHVPPSPFRQASQYAHVQAAAHYESAFRDGYLAALAGRHGLWTFGPTNEEDRVKTLGYADGQLAGDATWSAWLSKQQRK
jgi:hypothetical protein